jgi:hypothetical protein
MSSSSCTARGEATQGTRTFGRESWMQDTMGGGEQARVRGWVDEGRRGGGEGGCY